MSARPEDIRDLLDVLTCRPVDIDHYSLVSSNSVPIPLVPLNPRASSRGRLDILVPEILDHILRTLDIESLSYLRMTSYGCKLVVDSLREYSQLAQNAYEALRTLRSTRTIGLYSSNWLYQKLITSECETCKDYGKHPNIILSSCLKYLDIFCRNLPLPSDRREVLLHLRKYQPQISSH